MKKIQSLAMKKYAWLLKILVPLLAITVVAVTFARVPHWLHGAPHTAVTPPVADNGVTYSQEDKNRLNELIAVYAHMDSCRVVFASGAMDATDPADSTASLHSPFRFCKNGDELYYQTGDVEMIALKNIYVSVSHNTKKMFVGPARKVMPPFQLPADSLVRIWMSEHYTLAGSAEESKGSVRLLCGNHITCKEYRFDYDPAARVLKGLYMRLTNLNDPLNNSMDKEVKISINQWREDHIPDALLRPGSYLVQGREGWKPAGAYADYTLISLF
ncbi:hypothetical protein CLV51_1032 [Chitinophaga niastensis]|uniref:Uncharacterized protein n=1 Tax=Chitinophaga niastensis TaxID=536980 RepID=A0A2P8HII3_CHINA|nr:hypothetical protein [Chitinophaga niastensis]PSL46026.1 hypothetical protein CLV51_1032 [Chitinophaga niastensis]